MDDYYDYYYGHMLPHAGYISWFDLTLYKDGLMLNLPTRKHPEEIRPVESREKLFATLKEGSDWGKQMGVETVGYLNERICEGKINDLILVQEALQERKMAEIAREIVARDGVKFIMIAGPSSSGKTTTAGKLANLLRKQGKKPLLVACDIYRPAAIKQLQVVGAQLNIPVYANETSKDVVHIAKQAMSTAISKLNDVVILLMAIFSVFLFNFWYLAIPLAIYSLIASMQKIKEL